MPRLEPRLGVIGAEQQGLLITAVRLVQVVLIGKHISEVGVDLGIVGFKTQHLAIAGNRVVKSAQRFMGIAEVGQGSEICRLKSQCILIAIRGFGRLALLIQGDSEVVICRCMIRL